MPQNPVDKESLPLPCYERGSCHKRSVLRLYDAFFDLHPAVFDASLRRDIRAVLHKIPVFAHPCEQSATPDFNAVLTDEFRKISNVD